MAAGETKEKTVPFRGSNLSKKKQVEAMFDHIAFRYDLLNHLLSAGIDRGWRKKAVLALQPRHPQYILDVATGTADVAVMAQRLLQPQKIVGIDISRAMLELGQQKIRRLGLEANITLQQGDSETISFDDNTFDAITVAFGVRNFEHLQEGLSEMRRVLKPGGQVVILEFSRPSVFPVKQLFNFYFRFITPFVGRWIARSREAYSYLPDSVRTFPQGLEMINILKETGYQSPSCKPLTFGICSVYSAFK